MKLWRIVYHKVFDLLRIIISKYVSGSQIFTITFENFGTPISFKYAQLGKRFNENSKI